MKELLEAVARAEAFAKVSPRAHSSSTEKQKLTGTLAAPEFTAQKVPATASSEPC
jgi:hypothetical protein